MSENNGTEEKLAMGNAFTRAVLVGIAAALVGCSTFALSEQQTPLNVTKHRRATERSVAVLPFTYQPTDADEIDKVSQADLDQWQVIFAEGIDRSNLFGEVLLVRSGQRVPTTSYLIDGEITKFNFQKNWVPTLFPLHVGLSFFTFTAYTWLAGPTTITDVDFGIRIHLRDARTAEPLGTFIEFFEDTSAQNIYSKGVNNPYDNPSLVFSEIVDRLSAKVALALPGANVARTTP